LNHPIALQIHTALWGVFSQELFIIAGRHIQRDESGIFRFLPGKNKQTLRDDVGAFSGLFVACCRGVGFNIRIKETESLGVSVDVTCFVSKDEGEKLMERHGTA